MCVYEDLVSRACTYYIPSLYLTVLVYTLANSPTTLTFRIPTPTHTHTHTYRYPDTSCDREIMSLEILDHVYAIAESVRDNCASSALASTTGMCMCVYVCLCLCVYLCICMYMCMERPVISTQYLLLLSGTL